MRLLPTILALSTLCLTSCAKDQPRAAIVGNDPARLAACPATLPAAPQLVPLEPFTLPDGRIVVLLDTVIAREAATAHYIIATRGGWANCRSVVDYVAERDTRLAERK